MRILRNGVLLLLVALLGFTASSCKRDNYKLLGEWSIEYDLQNVAMDSSQKYNFVTDSTYILDTYNALDGNTYKDNGTYILNWMDQTIIFDEGSNKKREYVISEYTDDKLQLVNTDGKGEISSVITLNRVK